ncbi:GW dipeptide domain-containing protein [Mammaliicoccus fleurettii]|uniref:GW dipeptide domain-containing protein n=1 Tax=Mammaliicoccus fleurettii TaxID=150056 RepID=UPI0018E4ED6D|nr:GW dipeptide domain-containing protein [Mammaliicoccus fleurettii]
MDKKFYYKTPALVAMTLAGTTLVSHQVNAEETSNKDNKNIIEQHNNASQIQDEQKELKSQSLNVSGTKTYKDPSIIDEPKVTEDTSKDTSDVVNTDNTASQDVTNQDSTEAVQDTEDNTSEDTTDVVDSDNTASQDVTNQDSTEAVQDTVDNTSKDTTDVVNSDNSASQDVEDQDSSEVAQDTEDNTAEDASDVVDSDNTASQDFEDQDSSEVAQDTEDSTSEDTTDDVNSDNTASQDVTNQDSTEAVQDTVENTSEDTSDVVDSDESTSQDVTNQDSTETVQDTEDNTSEDTSDVVDSDESASQDVEEQDSSEVAQDTEDNTSEDTSDVVDSGETTSQDVDDQDSTEAVQDTEDSTSEDTSDVVDSDESASQDVEDQDSSEVAQDTEDNTSEDTTDVVDSDETTSQDVEDQDNTKGVQDTEDNTSEDTSDVVDSDESASQDVEDQDGSEVAQDTEDNTSEDTTDVVDSDETSSQDVDDQDSSEVAQDTEDNTSEDTTDVVDSDETSSQDVDDQDSSEVAQDTEENTSDDEYNFDFDDQDDTSNDIESNSIDNNQNVQLESANVKPQVRTFAARSARSIPTSTYRSTYNAAVSSTINNQIRSNNYAVPNYVEDFSSHIPKIPYRNGVGKPEGVIAHETANPNSTIHGEIAYMKNNYENAFVHAFIDDNNIIEVAPTDYLAWGAGGVANQRFIHVELVRVYGGDRFARSINNYADYIATNLAYYGLPFDSAEYDGNGTLWSHDAVSKYLGGTNHSDPYGWFAENNYTFNELVDLVHEKYQYKTGTLTAPSKPIVTKPKPTKPVVKPTPKPTKPVVTKPKPTKPVVKPTPKPTKPVVTKPKPTKPVVGTAKTVAVNYKGKVNINASGVYSSVYDTTTKPATNKAGKIFNIGKQSTFNNQVFYLLQDNNGTPLGWVKSSDIQLQTVTKPTPKPVVKPTTKPVAKPTTKPVAKPTTKPVAKPTTKPVAKPATKPVAKPATKPVASTAKTVAVSYKGKVNTNASGVYSSVYDKTTKPAVNKAGKTFNIGKQSTYNNQVFYLLQDTKGTPLGWVKSSDIQLQNTTKPVVKPATKPVAKPATKPVVKPATKPVAKPATKPVAKPATKPVAKPATRPVAKPTTKPVAKTVRVNYVGKVNNNISGVYTSVYDQKTVPAMNKAGRTFKIGKQSTYNNQTYYLLQDNNAIPLGWVKANDVQLQTNRVQPKPVKQVTPAQPKKTNAIKSNVVNNQPMNLKENYTNYLIFDNTGYFYSQPNESKSTLLGSLQNYQYAYFKVISSQKVGNELWYKGLLNGKTVWINSKYLQLATEATNISTSPYTLDQAVDIQMALRNGSEPKKVLPSGIRNATRAEVKDAMDTSKYVNDPVQKYQFLDLNKSQNISPSKLNELLRGKGILENQGNAFSQASKAVGINEIYLISHALLETGNGTSQLANGGNIDKNGKVDLNSKTKYYNMFGVGAIDKNALYGGIKYAQQAGWNTPEKAIFGGAQFIANNYIKAGQNTLYKMRFNPQKPGVHQYATGVDFSKSNAKRISDFYQQIQTDGQFYDVDQYKS